MLNSVSRLFPETLLITTSIHCRILTSRVGLQLPDIRITTQGRTFPITWLTSVQQWQGSIVCIAEFLKVISQGLVQNHNIGLFIALNCESRNDWLLIQLFVRETITFLYKFLWMVQRKFLIQNSVIRLNLLKCLKNHSWAYSTCEVIHSLNSWQTWVVAEYEDTIINKHFCEFIYKHNFLSNLGN